MQNDHSSQSCTLKRNPTFLHLIAWTTFAVCNLLAFVTPGIADGPVSATIPLPCSPDSKSGFMRPCSEFMPTLLGNLNQLYNGKLGCIKKELDVNVFAPPKENSATAMGQATEITCTDYPSKPFEPFCNLASGEVTSPNTDHKATNKNCGAPAVMVAGKIYAHGTVGTQETLYIQGAFVQSFISCNASLIDEITTKKQFKQQQFKQQQFTSSACASGALTDYQQSLSEWNKLVAKAQVKSLSETEYASVEKYCSGKTAKNAASSDPDKLKHQMAVCYLSAARTHLEAMVSYLASCELFSRWTLWWYLNMPKFRRVIQDTAADCDISAAAGAKTNCFGCCSDWCPDWSHSITRDADDYEKLFNTCYSKNLSLNLKKKIDELIPSKPGGCL